MRLYCSPGTASPAPQIAFREIGVDVEIVGVDLASMLTTDGQDFTELDPLECVPLLVLDDGSTFRQVPVILHYAAGLAPSASLAPMPGTLASLRIGEWLSFLTGDLDPALKSLARPATASEAGRAGATLLKRFAWIDVQLSIRPFLTSHGYSIADIYLWVLMNRAEAPSAHAAFDIDLDLRRFDNVHRWHERIAEREAVRAALEAERLLFRLGS